MGRYREPYTLYPRTVKAGRVWYYRTYSEAGARTAGISTGQRIKGKAREVCEALLREGKLGQGLERASRAPTLSAWANSARWWTWTDDGPACAYCRGELARSSAGAPAIQRDHADRCGRILRDNILPAHGGKRLDRITPSDCEELMAAWIEEGASPKTVNNRASVYRVMLGEAERLELIPRTPWARVKAYRAALRPKGILTLEEYRLLMDPRALVEVWAGHHLYYTISLLASVTGMRQGEILALRRESVHKDHVIVEHSYNRKYGDGPQKTKRGTDHLPIPRMVYDQIKRYLAWPGYVFSYDSGGRPVEGARTNEAFKAALSRIGIDEASRASRKISFHSWRAFANTYFRAAGVPDAKVRQITRHVTEKMTEHYSAFRLEDFAEVVKAQAALVRGLKG